MSGSRAMALITAWFLLLLPSTALAARVGAPTVRNGLIADALAQTTNLHHKGHGFCRVQRTQCIHLDHTADRITNLWTLTLDDIEIDPHAGEGEDVGERDYAIELEGVESCIEISWERSELSNARGRYLSRRSRSSCTGRPGASSLPRTLDSLSAGGTQQQEQGWLIRKWRSSRQLN